MKFYLLSLIGWFTALPWSAASITAVTRSVSAYSPGYTYMNGANLVTVVEDSGTASNSTTGLWDQSIASHADYVGVGVASQRVQVQSNRIDIFNMEVRSSGFSDLPDLFHAQTFPNATGSAVLAVSFQLDEPNLYEFNAQFVASAISGSNYAGSLSGAFDFSQPFFVLPPGGIYDPLHFQGLLLPGTYTFRVELTAEQSYNSSRTADWASVTGAALTLMPVPEPQVGVFMVALGVIGTTRRMRPRNRPAG